MNYLGTISTWTLLFVGLTAVGIALGWLISRRSRGDRFYHPGKLFKTLCREHQLDSAQRNVLLALAREHCPDHPARVFLSPQWFSRSMTEPRWRQFHPQLQYLSRRLFGDAA